MVYGDLNKDGEGLARLKENEWVKLFVDGGDWILAKIKSLNQAGLDIERYSRNSNRPIFEPYDAFVSYKAITGFIKIPEAEAKEFLENEPGLKRYLDGYVKLTTSQGSMLLGRLAEVRTGFSILRPYVHSKLEDDLLELCEKGSLLVVTDDVKTVMPSSLDEIKNYVDRTNKKIEEAKKKEETRAKE